MAKRAMQSQPGPSRVSMRGPGTGGGMYSQVTSKQSVHNVKGPAAKTPVGNSKK